jgi:hypothetical protein
VLGDVNLRYLMLPIFCKIYFFYGVLFCDGGCFGKWRSYLCGLRGVGCAGPIYAKSGGGAGWVRLINASSMGEYLTYSVIRDIV